MAREAAEHLGGHLQGIRTDWHGLKEKWFHGETLDPVFEGVVRDFCQFDENMSKIYQNALVFLKGVDQLASGMTALSESVIAGIGQSKDSQIASDSCKLKEATNQVARADAPHSSIAKLKRDMQFNIMGPMQSHLSNNRNLRISLDVRRRKLVELTSAKKQYDDCVRKGLSNADNRFMSAQSALETAKLSFNDVDRHVFEWLYILEEYRGDILDSTLQTLKYLQYEFFATSAHALSAVLPARMEFRPMVEMTPDHLETQVELELQVPDQGLAATEVTDFAVRLIEKKSQEEPGEEDQGPQLPVDPLSLSSLLSQGFEEGPARRALRLHKNDTQAALDWLINGQCEHENKTKQLADGVRLPTTLKRVKKLKAMRLAQQEKCLNEGGDTASGDESNGSSRRSKDKEGRRHKPSESDDSRRDRPPGGRGAKSSTPAQAPAPVDMLFGGDPPAAQPDSRDGLGDLLGLEPQPAVTTDFSQPVQPAPLPVQLSFDAALCEKPPLPAAVAAGIAQPRQAPDHSGVANDSLSTPGVAALTAASGPSDIMAAVQAVAAQSHVTPEQLLSAAQQLMVQGTSLSGPWSANVCAQTAHAKSAHIIKSAGSMRPTSSSGLDSLDPFATP